MEYLRGLGASANISVLDVDHPRASRSNPANCNVPSSTERFPRCACNYQTTSRPCTSVCFWPISCTRPLTVLSFPAIPLALILLRVAYTQARRLIGGRTKPNMSYVVKWGRER